MSLEEDVRRTLSAGHGRVNEKTPEARLENVSAAVTELQTIVIELAKHIDALKTDNTNE